MTFIDPAGWTGYGLEKIRPLLALRGEVIINFMFDRVNQFLENRTPKVAATFDGLFGGPGWHEEAKDSMAAGQSREDAILEVYRERLRRFGAFGHVTSTRILKPLSDRSYFHLVYGTRSWKGVVEFRGVEKKAIDEQETIRGATKRAIRVERTGQEELFGRENQFLAPLSYKAERTKRLDDGRRRLDALLKHRRSIRYEDLLGEVLEVPLVWRSDVNEWLAEHRAAGRIEIPKMRGRDRTAKRGYEIYWKGESDRDGEVKP